MEIIFISQNGFGGKFNNGLLSESIEDKTFNFISELNFITFFWKRKFRSFVQLNKRLASERK